MAVAKYRPSLTFEQLQAIVFQIEEYSPTPYNDATRSALKVLKIHIMNIEDGTTSSAYVATGKKPGPANARDILLSGEKVKNTEELKELAASVSNFTLEEALKEARMNKGFGITNRPEVIEIFRQAGIETQEQLATAIEDMNEKEKQSRPEIKWQ